MRAHFGSVCVIIAVIIIMSSGCATQSVPNNSASLKSSAANTITTNTTNKPKTSTSNATQLTNSTTSQGGDAATEQPPAEQPPIVINSMPGSMLSNQWPVNGAHPTNVGVGGIFEVNYTSSGPTIGGVHWTWPPTDTNPMDYVVVPTVVHGRPCLVWCHLSPIKKLGSPENGSAGYGPNQLEPTGPSQMWMTPWTTKGGSLSADATLITNDIPPVFSTSGQYVFPANLKDNSPQSLATSAWTGWFQWGNALHPYTLPEAKQPIEPTVAEPNGLSPAYNGVILEVQTQVLYANQGGAINVYYLDLANRSIVGLASLTNGGGLFFSERVTPGIAFTGAAESTIYGGTQGVAYVYNEVTGQRTAVESSAVMSQNNGFNQWVFRGSKIYDANNKLQADLHLPESVMNEPSASTFGVPIR